MTLKQKNSTAHLKLTICNQVLTRKKLHWNKKIQYCLKIYSQHSFLNLFEAPNPYKVTLPTANPKLVCWMALLGQTTHHGHTQPSWGISRENRDGGGSVFKQVQWWNVWNHFHGSTSFHTFHGLKWCSNDLPVLYIQAFLVRCTTIYSKKRRASILHGW